jgi:uncharacterized membrane protein YcaP (DUF421 family)
MSGWLVENWRDLWQIPVSAIAMLTVVILSVRLIGLRAFSKMSSFDFAVTVSIGSILGGVVATSVPIFEGAVAVASLLAAQAVVSWVRARQSQVEAAIDNTPLLLMDGPTMLEDNMRAARVTRSDIIAKLREANATRLEDVRAVVLETTGDISVLHGDHLDDELLQGVRRSFEDG